MKGMMKSPWNLMTDELKRFSNDAPFNQSINENDDSDDDLDDNENNNENEVNDNDSEEDDEASEDATSVDELIGELEARDQEIKGQVAVALVTINRVKSRRFPNSICKVVYQATRKNGRIVLHKCHFSWYCDGRSDKPKDKMSWEISLLIARAMLKDPITDFLHGATHYHRVDVNPYWNRRMIKFTTIGDHIFYIDALNR